MLRPLRLQRTSVEKSQDVSIECGLVKGTEEIDQSIGDQINTQMREREGKERPLKTFTCTSTISLTGHTKIPPLYSFLTLGTPALLLSCSESQNFRHLRINRARCSYFAVDPFTCCRVTGQVNSRL